MFFDFATNVAAILPAAVDFTMRDDHDHDHDPPADAPPRRHPAADYGVPAVLAGSRADQHLIHEYWRVVGETRRRDATPTTQPEPNS